LLFIHNCCFHWPPPSQSPEIYLLYHHPHFSKVPSLSPSHSSTDHRWLLCSCLSTCELCEGWVSVPVPFSAQLCLPLWFLLALNGVIQSLLTASLGTSGTATPEIQVRRRKEILSWLFTLCQALWWQWDIEPKL
jgi:hypothetical protein